MRQHRREVDLRARLERLAGSGDFSTTRAAVDRELRAALGYDVGALSTPRAALPSRHGRWITLHASGLRTRGTGDELRLAIIIEATRPIVLSDLIAEAYGLTPREREVTSLITAGLANKEIAQRLGISRYTAEDHVKSIFAKTSVTNRGSLVALLQREQYQPRSDAGHHPGRYGWYLDDSVRIAV